MLTATRTGFHELAVAHVDRLTDDAVAITFDVPDDLAVTPNERHAKGQFDIVVANILSSPLKLMAPMLSGRVAPGGSLILSGVLARQADEVAAAYAPFIKLGVWAEQDGWVALHGTLGQDTAPAPRSAITG